MSTGEITSYLNSNEVDETNNSDEDTSANTSNDTASDTMLNHLEEHIKRAIKTPLFKRYDNNKARPVLQKISFLDPRYRSHYIELAQKDFIIRLIKQEMDEIGHQMEVDKTDKNTNIGGLAAFLGNLSNIPVETNSIQDLNQIELDKYLSLPSVGLNCNPLQWWKIFHSEFPTLAKLAMKYLCIQGTSVPSERIFSCAGNVITDHRSSLSPEHAEELIFLSMNAKYVSK
ncbi:zinc finger BED domain-containing protein 1-like [Melanaphis sacchari]|uniref:zinc finger BED domain-containing protein 1-like n=1 Tax=Melanaphis sacchari TaxID=742174 RepID=UPI000DC134DE|nr:zinc finger BED domain-containing protein 1-like [Melanaphis sacchari]